ncbi:MAG TPA: nitroreductase [Clostridiales bacterium]|nr:nitroreductase [Clostridiales bacterium]
MELYNSIFRRKSIRRFKREALSAAQLFLVEEYMGKAQALYPSIQTKMRIAAASEIHTMLAIKSPHYLLFYSESKDGYLLNAGFILQQMDLFFSSQGFGSCWLGVAKSKEPSVDGLDFIIMLAFGTPEGKKYRESLSEFRRKPLSQIAQGEDPRLQAAQLAPSARNSQPWRFVCQDGDILLYRKRAGAVMGLIMDRLNQIDMGISLCHLMLASEKQGMPFTFDSRADLPKRADCVPVGKLKG